MAIGIDQESYPFTYNAIVSFVPRQAGVYVLLNSSGFRLGEADDLADGLLQTLMGRETAIKGQQPSTFQFEVVSGDEQRKARVSQLTKDFSVAGTK